MKRISLLLITLICCLLTGCQDDDPILLPEEMAVTYNSLAGSWELVEYCGSTLPEGTYMTLTFDRRNHTVEMEGNLNSAYATTRTSSFEISGDDYYGYTLSGSYGAVAGDWQYSYQVTMRVDNTMTWIADAEEPMTQLYRRIETD